MLIEEESNAVVMLDNCYSSTQDFYYTVMANTFPSLSVKLHEAI
jgi:hypothetical protein